MILSKEYHCWVQTEILSSPKATVTETEYTFLRECMTMILPFINSMIQSFMSFIKVKRVKKSQDSYYVN